MIFKISKITVLQLLCSVTSRTLHLSLVIIASLHINFQPPNFRHLEEKTVPYSQGNKYFA